MSSDDDSDAEPKGAENSRSPSTTVTEETETERSLRAQVGRLRRKVRALEDEKAEMTESFRVTTSLLLERIKTLEQEKAGLNSRPGTALVLADMPKALSAVAAVRHTPEVLTLEEDPAEQELGACSPAHAWRSELLAAAEAGDAERAQSLLDADADPNAVLTESGDTMLHVGARKNALDLVRLAVSYDGDLDSANASGQTSLHVSTEAGHVVFVKHLVELGAMLDPRTAEGETPLHCAARRGQTRIANYLIAQKADVHATNEQGDSVVELAQ